MIWAVRYFVPTHKIAERHRTSCWKGHTSGKTLKPLKWLWPTFFVLFCFFHCKAMSNYLNRMKPAPQLLKNSSFEFEMWKQSFCSHVGSVLCRAETDQKFLAPLQLLQRFTEPSKRSNDGDDDPDEGHKPKCVTQAVKFLNHSNCCFRTLCVDFNDGLFINK